MTKNIGKLKSDSTLIELVRQKPLLFDKSHKLYLNNIMKHQIWEGLAKDAGFESYFYNLSLI
jgi:hypothetical protein